MLTARKILCLYLALTLFISCNKEKAEVDLCDKDDISSPYLLTVQEAQRVIANESNVILIQISTLEKYNTEHIPNAINLWRPDFRSRVQSDISGLTCSKSELEDLLSAIGVDSSSSIIVYDNKGSVDAFRFTWVLDLYGFHNHKVINGGLTSWKRSGLPTTTESFTSPGHQEFKIHSSLDSTLIAHLSDVRSAINDPNTILVDTRESYEYLGQPFIDKNEVSKYKKGAYASGAIPTAIHLNWSTLSDLADDHRIKCKKDLKYDLLKMGITPDKNIIVYCQSGSRSSHTAFVLRHILGYPNVQNYDGSWIEWSYEYAHNQTVNIDQKTDLPTVKQMSIQLQNEIANNQKD